MKFYPDNPEKVDKLIYASFKRAYSFGVRKIIAIGGRGYGKGYSTKRTIFSDFVKHGKQFAWIRTTDTALELIRSDEQFFGRLKFLSEIGVESHRVVGNRIYINDKLAGYFFSVNCAHNVKGGEYEVQNVVWDEFMKFGNERPVKNKRKLFFDLVESISRAEAARIYMISNSTNRYDDVLAPFKLDLSLGFGCYLFREQDTVVHYMKPSKAYSERVSKNMSFEGMTEGERTMAFSNTFFEAGDFGNLSKATYAYSIQIGDYEFLTFYFSNDKYYCKSGLPKDVKEQLTKIYTVDNTYVSSKVNKIPQSSLKSLKFFNDKGLIVFENGYCRDSFLTSVA